jgi:hypothetical protein
MQAVALPASFISGDFKTSLGSHAIACQQPLNNVQKILEECQEDSEILEN